MWHLTWRTLIVLPILFISTPTAIGADFGSGNPDSDSGSRAVTVSENAGNHSSPGEHHTGTNGTRGSNIVCWSETGTSVDVRTGPLQLQPASRGNILYPIADPEHTWQITHCQHPDGTWVNNATLILLNPPTPNAPPPPTLQPQQLALRATAKLDFTFPVLNVNPPRTQYLGFPTWIWISPTWWQPRTATDNDGGLSITLTATPHQLTFSPGDNSPAVVCKGPGTAWNPERHSAWAESPTCGHTYTQAPPNNTVSTRTTITFIFTWQASNGTTGTLPDLTITHDQDLAPRAYTTTTD